MLETKVNNERIFEECFLKITRDHYFYNFYYRYTDPNSNKRKKSEKIDQYEEHLIPEFCKRIIFPSVYWLKATPLPAIIHRVKQLVVADEFRRMIVRETGMGVETLPVGTNWSPLLIKEERKDDPMDNLEANLDDTLGEIVISSDESLDVSTPEVDGNIYCLINEY